MEARRATLVWKRCRCSNSQVGSSSREPGLHRGLDHLGFLLAQTNITAEPANLVQLLSQSLRFARPGQQFCSRRQVPELCRNIVQLLLEIIQLRRDLIVLSLMLLVLLISLARKIARYIERRQFSDQTLTLLPQTDSPRQLPTTTLLTLQVIASRPQLLDLRFQVSELPAPAVHSRADVPERPAVPCPAGEYRPTAG